MDPSENSIKEKMFQGIPGLVGGCEHAMEC